MITKETKIELRHWCLIRVGDITSRLTSDTTQVSDLISQNVNLFLRSFVKAVGFFIFMFGMSWKLTLVTIMGFPYIAVLSKLYGEYYKVRVQTLKYLKNIFIPDYLEKKSQRIKVLLTQPPHMTITKLCKFIYQCCRAETNQRGADVTGSGQQSGGGDDFGHEDGAQLRWRGSRGWVLLLQAVGGVCTQQEASYSLRLLYVVQLCAYQVPLKNMCLSKCSFFTDWPIWTHNFLVNLIIC